MKIILAVIFCAFATTASAITYKISGFLDVEEDYTPGEPFPYEIFGTIRVEDGQAVAWSITMPETGLESDAEIALGYEGAALDNRLGESTATPYVGGWSFRTVITEGDKRYSRTGGVNIASGRANFDVWNFDWGRRFDTFGCVCSGFGEVTVTTAVPLPASGLLLLGGLVAVRRLGRKPICADT